MERTGVEQCVEVAEMGSEPLQTTAAAVAFDELHHPPENVQVTATSSSLQPAASVKSIPRRSWRRNFRRHFRSEILKIFHFQMDCGLYGNDWRLIHAGSSLKFINPWALMLLRGAVAITHLAMLIWVRFYEDLLFFTTWTNLMALLAFWLWTFGSIGALCSLSRQRRQTEAACSSDTSASSGSCCSFFSFFRGAHEQYRQLLKEHTELSCSCGSAASSSKAPPLRRWFAFRRPFSGGPRRPGLEAFLCLHDIAVSLALPMNIIMFLVYWIMLLPKASESNMSSTVYLHLCCPVATWVMAVLSRVPYRLTLFPLTILLGVIYEVMIASVQSFGFGFVYWFMNFQENPGLACGVCAGLILVLNPATACLAFLVLSHNNAAVVDVDE